MTWTEFTNGTTADADEVNANFDICLTNGSIKEIYTGSDYDTSQAAAGTDEQSYEMTAISSSDLTDVNYLKITMVGNARTISQGTSTDSEVELKIQTKETGGAYSDVLSYQHVCYTYKYASSDQDRCVANVTYLHELTAGEKTNGVQVKVFSKSSSADANNSALYTNINTFIELKS